MLFYKRLLPDYLQMLFLRKLKIVLLRTLKFGLNLPYFMAQFIGVRPQRWPAKPLQLEFLNVFGVEIFVYQSRSNSSICSVSK